MKCWQCGSRQDLTIFGRLHRVECTRCTVSISIALGLYGEDDHKAKPAAKKVVCSKVLKRIRKAA